MKWIDPTCGPPAV